MIQLLKAKRPQFQAEVSMSLSLQDQWKETRKATEEMPIMLSNVHQRFKTHVKFQPTEITWGWNIIHWYCLKQFTIFSHFMLAKAHVQGLKFILQDLSEKYWNSAALTKLWRSRVLPVFVSAVIPKATAH